MFNDKRITKLEAEIVYLKTDLKYLSDSYMNLYNKVRDLEYKEPKEQTYKVLRSVPASYLGFVVDAEYKYKSVFDAILTHLGVKLEKVSQSVKLVPIKNGKQKVKPQVD